MMSLLFDTAAVGYAFVNDRGLWHSSVGFIFSFRHRNYCPRFAYWLGESEDLLLQYFNSVVVIAVHSHLQYSSVVGKYSI